MVRSCLLKLICIALACAYPALACAIDTATGIYDPRIKTLSLRNPDSFISPPVIRLGSDDRLVLNFDIVGDSHEYLRYRLLHCNADWTPSRLLESEYVEGFNEAQADDYAYSSNTFVHYVNYNIEIPGNGMAPLVSGNYLLQVFQEDDADSVLLQARFSVSENVSDIGGFITSRTDRGYNTEWQQIGLDIDISGIPVRNPYQDLVVTVTQNNRPETTRTISHPMRVEGSHVIFEHDPALIFGAGNEYRRFETVRADYAGMHTDSVAFGGTNWHAYLTPDEVRADKDYYYDSTQHGRFMIDEYNASDPNLGADYVTVHFSLDSPEIIGADVYVDGDFALHRFNDTNRMRYDRSSGLYTAEIPLKQGSYNYQYVVLPSGEHADSQPGNPSTSYPDPAPIEGNKYETVNEYLVKVFYRPPGARADRLIGTQLLK